MMDKDLIRDKLYKLIDQFNEKKSIIEIFILHYSTRSIHYDGDGRSCKKSIINVDKVNRR